MPIKEVDKLNYTGIAVICPYYIKESNYKVYCEGVEAQTEWVKKFESVEKKKGYMKMVCGRYEYAKRCRHAGLIEKIYSFKENEK